MVSEIKTGITGATGLPILLVAFLGGAIHRLVPNICSFTDYTYRRFGPFVQVHSRSSRVTSQQSSGLLIWCTCTSAASTHQAYCP